MDIYCPRCGEPWELDSLHEEAQARYGVTYYTPGQPQRYGSERNPAYSEDRYKAIFKVVREEFQARGCGSALHTAFTNGNPCERRQSQRTLVAQAAYELLGDDLDGAASMFEDYL